MRRFFVRVRARTWERLHDLQRIYDLDVFGQTAKQREDGTFQIEGLLSDEDVQRLQVAGYEVELISNADQVARERLKEVPRQPREGDDEPDQEQGAR